MKTPLTHHELEELLRKQGTVQPAMLFHYQPCPHPTPLFKRRAVLLIALLSLLFLAMLMVPLAAHLSVGSPAISTPSDNPITNLPQVTTQPISPDDPPITLPPTTNTPMGYLPDSYGIENLTLNLMIPSNSTDLAPHSIRVVETDDYKVSNAYLSAKALAGGQKIVSACYAKVDVTDTAHSHCTQLFYNLSTEELLCIDHKLQELLSRADTDLKGNPLPTASELNLYTFDHAADRFLFWIESGECYYYYLVDFASDTIRKIEIPLSGPDIGFISPDFSYMILREPSADHSDEHCRVISLLSDTTLTPFGNTPVFGDPLFSADGRFFLMRRTDLSGNNWLAFDSATGQVTECNGEFCYLTNTTALTKTDSGYLAYDCTNGSLVTDLSTLPLALHSSATIQYTASVHQYTLKLYDPVSGKLYQKLEEVAAYALSEDSRWLYYYKDGEDHLTLYDLNLCQSYTLPLSEEFVSSAHTEDGVLRYSLTVSRDRSLVAIGYTVEPKAEISETLLYRYESEALLYWMIEALDESGNLQDLIAQFENSRFADHPIVVNTAADIYEDYVIWQVLYLYQPASPSDIPYHNRVLRVVEDYRNNTLTLYRGDYNPHYIPGISGSDQLTDVNFYEYGDLYIRRTSQNADYDATCKLLSAIGNTIGCKFDYGKCYDENGEWSNTLAQQAICDYEYLKNNVTTANGITDPQKLDTLLQILARNPRTDRAKYQFTPAWRVQVIRLTDARGNQVYKGWLTITSKGKYYLVTEFFADNGPIVAISEADYTAIMELYGGFLYESGLYKNPRLSGLDINFTMGSYINYDTGMFSGTYLCCDNLDTVKELYNKGNTSDRKLLSLLFEGSENRTLLFVSIAVEDSAFYEWEQISQDGRTVRFTAENGKLISLEISDPS